MADSSREGGPALLRSGTNSALFSFTTAVFKMSRIVSWDLPGGSSGSDSTFPMQGAQVQSQVRELRSLMIHSVAPQIFFNFRNLYPNILFFKIYSLIKLTKVKTCVLSFLYQKF